MNDNHYWNDPHKERRGHALITKELFEKIPKLGHYENRLEDGTMSYDEVEVPVKLFSPYTGWTWYVTEWHAETETCFGMVDGWERELGSFCINELSNLFIMEVPAVERDCHWDPKTLGQIKKEVAAPA